MSDHPPADVAPAIPYALDPSDPLAPGLDPNDPTLSPIEAQAAKFYLPQRLAHLPPTTPETPVVATEAPPHLREVPAAVKWVGSWVKRFDGTAIITRQMANDLDRAGLPVFLPPSSSLMRWDIDPFVRAEVETLTDRIARSAPVTIYHLIPSERSFQQALYPGQALEHARELAEEGHARKILFSVWEQLPNKPWAKGISAMFLRKFAHHIVPCDMNREVLLLAGVEPEKISVIPHSFAMEDARYVDAFQRAEKPADEPYRFYTIGKWEPRKDPVAVIRCFVRAVVESGAFTGSKADTSQAPHLTVVTSRWWNDTPAYPGPERALQAVADELGLPLALVTSLVDIDMSEYQTMMSVHLANDCFLSASHGEAWCMPAHAAVLAGNPVIAPKWGGFAAYVEDEGVPFTLAPVLPEYAFDFKAGARGLWAKIDEDAFVRMIRNAYETRLPQRPYSDANYEKQNPTTVGRQLRAVVDKVVPGYPWFGGGR